ncbi:terminase small subunit, partial [Lactobacillus crispatus]
MKEIEKLALDLMADWPSTRNQQKQFVLEYMKNGFSNATKAAIAAGYTKK